VFSLDPASLCVSNFPFFHDFAPIITVVVMFVAVASVAKNLKIALEVSEVGVLGAWLYVVNVNTLSPNESAAPVASLVSLLPRADYVRLDRRPVPISTKLRAEIGVI